MSHAQVTTMGAAFERAGVRAVVIELRRNIAKFLNKGGTLAELKAEFALAEQLSGEANDLLPRGQWSSASSRQQNGDAVDQGTRATGLGRSVLPSPTPSEQPANSRKPKGHMSIAKVAREPSVADLSAMREVRKVAASVTLTVLDTWKVRDGRVLGDVTFGELESLRFENAREASIIRQIQRHASADPSAKVRDVIKVDDIQRIIQRAAEVADAA